MFPVVLQLLHQVLDGRDALDPVRLVPLDALPMTSSPAGGQVVEGTPARVRHNPGRLKVTDVHDALVELAERELLRVGLQQALNVVGRWTSGQRRTRRRARAGRTDDAATKVRPAVGGPTRARSAAGPTPGRRAG